MILIINKIFLIILIRLIIKKRNNAKSISNREKYTWNSNSWLSLVEYFKIKN